jgi:radical SAM/Cys-rich protein
MLKTSDLLKPSSFPSINRSILTTLQVNLGFRCNLSCKHCHVNAGPNRTEEMSKQTIDEVLAFIQHRQITTLDLTGGAPELNPHFRFLVQQAKYLGIHVIDRCNLTVLDLKGQEDLAGFLAENRVEIVASLPCYLEDNVDSQRGKGSYQASIRVLRILNELGYAGDDSNLVLNLVYNPLGPSLPPAQEVLEAEYKKQLYDNFGIKFDRLFTITNMPIQRFGSFLQSKGEFKNYLKLLRDAHQPNNLSGVMCRYLISVDWQGYLYDCDFNQMLDMPLGKSKQGKLHLHDMMDCNPAGLPIQVADHCYGCTAGQGSSCSGAMD